MNKIKKPFSCGLGPAFDVIGGRWKATILWELHEAPVRFGELKKRIEGITEKVLIVQLREMETHGLVNRNAYDELPLRVEYSLTNSGHQLNTALDPLAEWGKQFVQGRGVAGQYVYEEQPDVYRMHTT